MRAVRSRWPAQPAAPPARADETVTFPLEEQNRAGRSGTATPKGGDRGFSAQLATVEVTLSELVDGKSKTRVDNALSQYRTGGSSINVHSYEGGFPVVACGNIPTE